MLNKAEIEEKIFSIDAEVCTHAILEMVFNADREEVDWVSAHLVKLSENTNPTVSGLALTCFGHLARLNGYMGDHRRVVALLEAFRNSPVSELRGRAEDALEDIEIFCSKPQTHCSEPTSGT
ncbi:MAG: hypothetical protein ACFNQI_06125 [Eikenella corrodens]